MRLRVRVRVSLGLNRGSVGKGRVVGLLRLCELLKQRLRRVKLKGQGGLADGHGRGLLPHFLPLQVAFQRIEEETVVGDTIPVEDLLLLLGADAVVLVQKVEKGTLWFFERSISARLEVSQVGEDAFFKLL